MLRVGGGGKSWKKGAGSIYIYIYVYIKWGTTYSNGDFLGEALPIVGVDARS
jgi:hypothetical protein